jgi:hypothetical protein
VELSSMSSLLDTLAARVPSLLHPAIYPRPGSARTAARDRWGAPGRRRCRRSPSAGPSSARGTTGPRSPTARAKRLLSWPPRGVAELTGHISDMRISGALPGSGVRRARGCISKRAGAGAHQFRRGPCTRLAPVPHQPTESGGWMRSRSRPLVGSDSGVVRTRTRFEASRASAALVRE